MKKINIFLYSLADGGAERVASILLNKLKDRFDITLVLMNETIFYDIPRSVKVVYLENSNPDEKGIKKLLKLPILGWRYKKICKKYSCDISLSLMNRPNYINILAKLFGCNAKVIVSERGTPSLYYKDDIQGKISKLLIKKLYPKADKVVANSRENAWDLTENFGLNKVATIYNPILERECKRKKENAFIFISIGRMDEGKNHKLLIDSFMELDINAKLWLIGDGRLRGELESKVKNAAMDDKIKFYGKQKDVYSFLSKADCFVFGSSYEGFPNVLLEALMCELPVVSTDCKSGPREILAPESDFKKHTDSLEVVRYGILVKPNSKEYMKKAMGLMYEDESLRYNFKKIAKQRALDFRVEKIIKKWERILDE